MEFILSWVKSGLLFGIFASVILLLSPNKSYMKHIGMVVGMLFIMVMLHPIMEFLKLDGQTYAFYIRNLLMMETQNDGISKENLELYEESLEIQLTAALLENGYPLKRISVKADSGGEIEKLTMAFDSGVSGLEKLELYLKSLFGEDVKISYEME